MFCELFISCSCFCLSYSSDLTWLLTFCNSNCFWTSTISFSRFSDLAILSCWSEIYLFNCFLDSFNSLICKLRVSFSKECWSLKFKICYSARASFDSSERFASLRVAYSLSIFFVISFYSCNCFSTIVFSFSMNYVLIIFSFVSCLAVEI